ncbi:MAG TPA: LLM class F420-dependent oxidoreductase [Mycobacterium sp.]|nr:LLM class F420-dependent oxidoreductase [Mycobacterium sp.]
MAIRLGLQIPNFSYGTGVEQLFPTVIAQAQEAESAGFDSVFVMDHFYQLPMLGSPDQPMLEAYTALGALATATQRVQLGTLVTGNTYRNPTLLAKTITTLDVVSQGRAILGIGTGWFELEHDQLGFEFGTFTDRFNRLDEALQIIVPMIKGERATFSGKWYRASEAFANPRFRDHIPLMIGGSGEKKTIPLAARHFDHLNVIAGFNDLPRKVEVVRRCCEEVGRDPATLETSMLITALVDENSQSRPDSRRDGAAHGGRQRRIGCRPNQNQGSGRGNRRRDRQPALLHTGHRRRGRRSAESNLRRLALARA